MRDEYEMYVKWRDNFRYSGCWGASETDDMWEMYDSIDPMTPKCVMLGGRVVSKVRCTAADITYLMEATA